MIYASLPRVPPINLNLTRLCSFAIPSFTTLFNNFLRHGSSSSMHSGIFHLDPACVTVVSAAWSESSGSCNESTVPVVSISVDARWRGSKTRKTKYLEVYRLPELTRFHSWQTKRHQAAALFCTLSAHKFDQYYKQLKALCEKFEGGRILSKLAVDPISQFLKAQIAKFPKEGEGESKSTSSDSTGEDADDDSTASSEEEPLRSTNDKSFKNIIKKLKLPEGAERSTKRLLKRIKALKIPSQDGLRANSEETAFTFCAQVNKSRVFSPDEKEKLANRLRTWTHSARVYHLRNCGRPSTGCSTIYHPTWRRRAPTTGSLAKFPSVIYKKFGQDIEENLRKFQVQDRTPSWGFGAIPSTPSQFAKRNARSEAGSSSAKRRRNPRHIQRWARQSKYV